METKSIPIKLQYAIVNSFGALRTNGKFDNEINKRTAILFDTYDQAKRYAEIKGIKEFFDITALNYDYCVVTGTGTFYFNDIKAAYNFASRNNGALYRYDLDAESYTTLI